MILVSWIILGYFILNVLYVFVLMLAGKFGRADDALINGQPIQYKRIGVLIPAYKEDAVIVDSVRANLQQDYPADRFELVVIADSLQPATLDQLRALPIRVIEVSFAVSTVAKAISTGLEKVNNWGYEVIVVSDADNIMASDFLSRINNAFAVGWRAVQGHRVAKNTNTSVAVLDAISEEINNHLFRQGYRALGLPASIIGSGMAFDYEAMKQAMATLNTMGGYDKELEMNLILAGHPIAYLNDAFIYDEKVANKAVFQNQRTRWIAAQWQFLTHYFRRGIAGLWQGRPAAASRVLQAALLPRVLLLGALGLSTMVGLLIGATHFWVTTLILLGILMGSLIASVPAYLRQRITLRELAMVPVLMMSFVKAVLNMRKAFRSFLPTPHTSASTVAIPTEAVQTPTKN